MQKHEWRKAEKSLYLPKAKPELVEVGEMKFITISGAGNPNSPEFTQYIEALYSIAYAIKMTLKKKQPAPVGYVDYTVYPLEGVWDITDEAKANFDGTINKDDLVFTLMIRQPDFVTEAFFSEMVTMTKAKKANPLLDEVLFCSITEGQCVQMLHLGPFDDEPASFAKMEAFAAEQGLTRLSKVHREIYLSDTRKVAPEKLKTTLRFCVA
ncbi:GyrI-like domain-containing protein [Vibrio sp. SCSIO 43136]|uniref:GyrI-like domain-containing protein n=1 Tax=Vibrio sp. SCSIO 43136 TaxID=2819101 RepID=UPI002075AF62|nr:GyrI-like domain-containing protein [Vibrio sp. SCSIO 43136]USD67537.1 GyrI-like domain-containing protein [Vibrio sp. SCSIO 43136]